ncbi:hypothetical protein TNCV_3400581 [Trichonephila clavipes]|nr:hypothetical protein TNCV_3400581 [Trichonephila clavipes]
MPLAVIYFARFPIETNMSQRKWTRTAVRLFGERYLTRRQPDHQTFIRVHQNLAEHGSFRTVIESTERLRTACAPTFKEGVLYAVDQNLGTNVPVLAVATERPRTTVYRVLQGEALLPFHVHRVSLLQPDDHPRRVVFA